MVSIFFISLRLQWNQIPTWRVSNGQDGVITGDRGVLPDRIIRVREDERRQEHILIDRWTFT